jgi:hypothetical protein
MPNIDFVKHAPGAEGEEVNVNHDECPAGTDTKKRLYVKRVTGGVVAYCHNCGLAGYYMAGKSRLRPRKHMELSTPSVSGKVELPPTTAVSSLSNVTWLDTFLRDRDPSVRIAMMSSLAEVPSVDGCPILYRMIRREGAGTYGYQLRWTDGRMPKTKTYLSEKPSKGGWYGAVNSKTLVIVEDPLSALIISKTMGTKCSVLCLFGTHLNPATLSTMSGFTRIVVWLDNDPPGHKAAKDIVNRITYVYNDALVVNMFPTIEPKLFCDIERSLAPYV